MANLNDKIKNRKHAGKYGSGKRFYTALDMAILKHDEAVHNAQLKRGEKKTGKQKLIVVCGCGAEGCFLHIETNS